MASTSSDSAQARQPLIVRARTRAGRRWLDAPLQYKLLTGVLLVALVCLPPIGVGIMANAQLDEARDRTRLTTQKLDELDDLRDSVQEAIKALENYVTVGAFNPDPVEDYRAAAAQIRVQVASLLAGLPDELAPPAEDLASEIETLLTVLDDVTNFGVAGKEPANVSTRAGFYELNPALVDSLEAYLEAAADVYESFEVVEDRFGEQLTQDDQEVDRLRSLLVLASVASLLAALLAAAVVTFTVTAGVMRRIGRLADNVDRFLAGQRLLPLTESADEIGQLTTTMVFAGELLDSRRERAVAATRAKDEFLSRVSHELEAPVTAMVGSAERLTGDPGLSPESGDDLAHIVSAGHHLHDLIEEMLDIKAIEAGRLALTIEPLAVDAAVDDALTLVQPMAAERSLVITTDCPAELAVMADRRRLHEVLLNLLSNAVKYNRDSGRVAVAAVRQGDTVHISVTDTGPGISAEDQTRLFRPFERLGAATSNVEGSGLGLSLTKHVVEAMDGDIGVESRVGEGSTFWFDLPAADAGPAPGDASTPGRDELVVKS